jgi:hypothetical protein
MPEEKFCQGRKERPQDAPVLPSLKGLRILLSSKPSVETLGYCQQSQSMSRTVRRNYELLAHGAQRVRGQRPLP